MNLLDAASKPLTEYRFGRPPAVALQLDTAPTPGGAAFLRELSMHIDVVRSRASNCEGQRLQALNEGYINRHFASGPVPAAAAALLGWFPLRDWRARHMVSL